MATDMYTRNINRSSRTKNKFKFPSSKSPEMIVTESTLEFDTCFHLEYSKDIIFFKQQPIGFKFQVEGKTHSYTPDYIYINRKKQKFYLEIKYQYEIETAEFNRLYPAKRRRAEELGIPLILVSENQIRVEPILNNLKLLHRYKGMFSLNSLQEKILEIVNLLGLVKLSDLVKRIKVSVGKIKANTLALIAEGRLVSDITTEVFGIENNVWIPE